MRATVNHVARETRDQASGSGSLMNRVILSFVIAAAALGCASTSDDAHQAASTPITENSGNADAGAHDYEAEVIRGLHDTILTDIDEMRSALLDLQAAAPLPDGRGWDVTLDAQAIADMRAAWVRAREAYERVEGVIAPIFPYIDLPLDDRYEGFLAHLGGSGGDQYLFDNRGVTGMHAIERIIYLSVTPDRVIRSESVLPGYKAATLPSTPQEARDFKNLLCAKAISDAALLRSEWDSVQFNAALAFSGLVDLMMEQREKVNKASSNEEESRYSQRTMDDLRQNLAGTMRMYELFAPWIVSRPAPADGGLGGSEVDARIRAGFADLRAGYNLVPGANIPEPPSTWSSTNPSPADLASPFGQLYTLVRRSVNPNIDTSVVANMNNAGALLGFKE